jgi:hypothetical protein
MTDGPEEWPITWKTMSDGSPYAVHTISSALQQPEDEDPVQQVDPNTVEVSLTTERGLKALVDALTITYTEKGLKKARRILQPDEELISPVREAFFKGGGGFAKDPDAHESYCLLPEGKVIPLTTRPSGDFSKWLTKMIGRTPRSSAHDNLLHLLPTEENLKRVQAVGWGHYDPRENVLSILINSNGVVLRAPAGTELPHITSNGRDGLLHLESATPLPIEFTPDPDDIRPAFDEFAETFTENLACSEESRILLELYALATPLFRGVAPIIHTIPILHLRGPAGGGKTHALKLLSTFLHGQPELIQPTVAAAYRDAVREVLLPFDDYDNMEASVQDFFKMAATGITRIRSASGSDTETTVQKVHIPVAVTSVDHLTAEVLRRRALVVDVNQSLYPTEEFSEDCWGILAASRNRFWSAYILWVQREVLPNLVKKVSEYSPRIKEAITDSTLHGLAPPLALLYYLLTKHPGLEPQPLEDIIPDWINELKLTDSEMETTRPIFEALDMTFDAYQGQINSRLGKVNGETVEVHGMKDIEGRGYLCAPTLDGRRVLALEGTSTQWAKSVLSATSHKMVYSGNKFTRDLKDGITQVTRCEIAKRKPYRVGRYLITWLENDSRLNYANGWKIELAPNGEGEEDGSEK